LTTCGEENKGQEANIKIFIKNWEFLRCKMQVGDTKELATVQLAFHLMENVKIWS